jgi:Ca-activated chloride channel family protein
MNLLWPWALALLGLAPLLIGLYLWMLRRRKPYAVRYSSLSLVREALAPGAQWRRHLPFALFLLALMGLVVALARPVAAVEVPANQTAIMLTMDVSRSMCSTDIPPNRLVAAQAAALEFIERQPEDTRFGIVAFAGFAELVQQPTTDRATLEAAVQGLTTARGTAIGSGILAALEVIASVNPSVAPLEESAGQAPAPPAEGVYVPEVIVLLTDGVTTTGAPPLEAAQLAVARGVRIFTIGFGTPVGGSLSCGGLFRPSDGFGSPGGGFGGGGGGGGGFRRGIDEATLVQIATMTGGEYYAASSAGELQAVFENLPLSYTTKEETTEVGFIFAALGALLAILAIVLSLRWNPLP